MSEPPPPPAPPPTRPRAALLLASLVLAIGLVRGVEATSLAITPLRIYDEGIVLTEAMRLADGELPWRDYDPVYGPLEPLLLTPVTWAVGPQLLALRLLRALCAAGLVAVITASAWRLGARVGAVASAALLVVYLADEAHPVVLPIFATALLLDLAGPTLRRGPLLAAGALVGLTLLMRAEFAALALAAVVASIGLERLLTATVEARPWRSIREALRHVSVGALPFVAAWLVFVLVGGPARVLAQARETRAFMRFRELAYPLPPTMELAALDVARHWLLFALPLLVAVAAPVVLASRAFAARRSGGAPPPRLAVHLTLLLLGLLPYALWRPDGAHVLPAFCAALALVTWALASVDVRASRRSGGLALRAAYVALGLLLIVRAAVALRVIATTHGHVRSNLRGLRGVLVPEVLEATWAELARVVDLHAGGPEVPVFVGCGETTDRGVVPQHGRIFANDAFSYVVLGRPVGTRHHCFNPGVTTSAAKQAQIVADLDARGVRVAVLAFGTNIYTEEPGLSQAGPGARLLDDHLLDGWTLVADLGSWCVLARPE